MKTTTKEILRAAWERNVDLCDVMASCIERREGWDEVVRLWRKAPQWAWRIFQAASAEEWG